ncbi:MAG: D-alanine--D-alanine ligase family protein, partial [Dissulfurimicrobium sp.]
MRVAIIYNAVDGNCDPSELDVLDQAQTVGKALDVLGVTYAALPITKIFKDLMYGIERFRPDIVFNLVESVSGKDELHPNIAAVLELIGLPFTGSSARGLWLTTDKIIAKEIMQARGIPTPDFWTYPEDMRPYRVCRTGEWTADDHLLACGHDVRCRKTGGPWIVKPAAKDASIGIDEDAVFSSADDLMAGLSSRWKAPDAKPFLVERYIHGREFNISMLERPGGVECLPPAEIVFRNHPKGRPKILDWQAKWDTSALSYHNTVRSFDFTPEDLPLLEKLKALAKACWKA